MDRNLVRAPALRCGRPQPKARAVTHVDVTPLELANLVNTKAGPQGHSVEQLSRTGSSQESLDFFGRQRSSDFSPVFGLVAALYAALRNAISWNQGYVLVGRPLAQCISTSPIDVYGSRCKAFLIQFRERLNDVRGFELAQSLDPALINEPLQTGHGLLDVLTTGSLIPEIADETGDDDPNARAGGCNQGIFDPGALPLDALHDSPKFRLSDGLVIDPLTVR